MSQQKTIIVLAVCAFGLVAMVSAQSFDFETCQKNMRSQLDEYSRRLRSAGNKFVSTLQEHTDNALDTSAFQGDIDKLMNSFNSLVSQGTNFDAGRLSGIYMQNVQTMSSLMSTAFRMYMKMPRGAMSAYMEFGQSLMSAQSQLITSMTDSCMPTSRSQNSQ